jgi:predicted AlkP superfamily phosphohydrolase/phosphomutase
VLAHATRTIFEAIDREMGTILGAVPENANVVLVSSTGLHDIYPTDGLIESFCRSLGYQARPTGGRATVGPLDLVRRAVPERLRVAVSRHFSREARERLLSEGFRFATDWSRTRAFAIPGSFVSFVFANLAGRQPSGIVQPGREYDALLDELEADLSKLTDPVTGTAAVARTIRTARVFDCGPPDLLPDLVVEWAPATHFRARVLHPATEITQTQPEFFRGSDHTHTGFFAAAGPSIAATGDIGAVSPLAIAPTCLTLLGEPVPPSMAQAPILP